MHQHIAGEGENLYWAAPKNHPDDYYIGRALASWMREKTHNTNGTFNCCWHDHSCCHYTQVRYTDFFFCFDFLFYRFSGGRARGFLLQRLLLKDTA
jgi:hypothetical protein